MGLQDGSLSTLRVFEKSWEPHKKTQNRPIAPHLRQPYQVPQYQHPPHPNPRTAPRTRTHRTPIRALHAPKHLPYPRTTPQHLRMRRRTRPQPRRRTRPLPHPIRHTRHRQPTRLLQRPILSRARYPYNSSPANKVPQGTPHAHTPAPAPPTTCPHPHTPAPTPPPPPIPDPFASTPPPRLSHANATAVSPPPDETARQTASHSRPLCRPPRIGRLGRRRFQRHPLPSQPRQELAPAVRDGLNAIDQRTQSGQGVVGKCLRGAGVGETRRGCGLSGGRG